MLRNIKHLLPIWQLLLYKIFCFFEDIGNVIKFLFNKKHNLSLTQRFFIIRRLYIISFKIECLHTQTEILSFIKAILSVPKHIKGHIVEAGTFKGGSAAKFSIAAKIVNRKLIVFDSFKGLPENVRLHKDIFGKYAYFKKGRYCGTLEEVKKNIAKYGNLGSCIFVKGFFKKTMPNFSEPIAALFLDVDLASSTRTCLKYLYPLLAPGAVLFSHDGHLPYVIEIYENDSFWRKIGYIKPQILGIREKKLIKIIKPN